MPKRKKVGKYVEGAAKLQVSGYEKAEKERRGENTHHTDYFLPARKVKSGEYKGEHQTMKYSDEKLETGAEMKKRSKHVLDLRK